MSQFDDLIPYIFKYEGVSSANPGGYVNNPNDPGGETKFGISQRAWNGLQKAYPNYPTGVRWLTEAQAITIYQKEYYLTLFDSLLPGPALVAFDCQVNEGIGIKILQRALGVTDDGVAGPQTILQIRLASRNIPKFIEDILWKRVEHYTKCDPQFIHGWLNRLIQVRTDANRL